MTSTTTHEVARAGVITPVHLPKRLSKTPGIMRDKPSQTEPVAPSTAGKTNLADLIWKTAELLRGAFREPEYRRVILPFTVLRRLDCLLEPSKVAVLAKHAEIAPQEI